jgi:hypothetical protein
LAVLEDGSFAIGGGIYGPVTSFVAQFFRADGAPLTRPTNLGRLQTADDCGIASVGDRYSFVLRSTQRAYGRLYSEQGSALGDRFPWPYSAIRAFFGIGRFCL